MSIPDITSLSKTIDQVSEAFLFGRDISANEKEETAEFIVSRLGKPGSYAGMFAPSNTDMNRDLTLFTGERITSRVGKCHVIAEEASRVLRKLGSEDETTKTALRQADAALMRQIQAYQPMSRYPFGMYCCKSCSVALWLNLSSGFPDSGGEMLAAGLELLGKYRDNNGRWQGFPYFYSLYALNECEPSLAIHEIKYTAGLIEKRLKRYGPESDRYEIRRKQIDLQLLEKANSR